MKNNYIHLYPTWDVYCAGTTATRGRPQKYTIFAEVVSEALRLLSHSVPNTTVEIRAFTDLDAKDLNGSTAYLRRPFSRCATTSLTSEAKQSANNPIKIVRKPKQILRPVPQSDCIAG